MAPWSIRRRDFIVLAGGAATVPALLPRASRAQQPDRMRRVGVLLGTARDDTDAKARMAAFLEGLQQVGWTEGRNLRIETRWAAGSADDFLKYAAELAALTPDVILAPGGGTLAALLQATRAVPIVFVHVPDPVGAGFVDSMARPGGNATGFSSFEYSMGAKWL